MWPCLSSRMLLAHQAPWPQEQQGWGRGGYLCSGVRQDSPDSAIRFCTPKPVHVPSPEAEAHLQSQEPGFRVVHKNPQSPLKDLGSQSQDPPESTEGNSGLQVGEKWGVALPGSPHSGHDGFHGLAGLIYSCCSRVSGVRDSPTV